MSLAIDYYEEVVNSDLARLSNSSRDTEKVKRIMASYARNRGIQISDEGIKNDIQINENESLSVKPVRSYIDALKKIFVIEDMKAWNSNLRSKTAIRTRTRDFLSTRQ